MSRPRRNPYRSFLLSMADHWAPDQIADALEVAMKSAGEMQAFVLELAEKPQIPGQGPIGLPGAAQRKPEVLCSVCRFVPAELETGAGPMCMGCAAEMAPAGKEGEDGEAQEPVR